MERFRTEYLGQLKLHKNKIKLYDLRVGEIVLIGGDGVKRLNWPLARIIELVKGKAGNVRLVKLRTQNGELMRPVQRLFPLELKMNPSEQNIVEDRLPTEESSTRSTVMNKRGREIRIPTKYQD